MKRPVIVCCAIVFCGGGIACASVLPRSPDAMAFAAAAEGRATALDAAQDYAADNYKRNMSRRAAALKRKKAEAAAAAERDRKARATEAAASRATGRTQKNKVGSRPERVARQAGIEAEALAKAMDRAVAYYKRRWGIGNTAGARARAFEKLACFAGVQDRHARIGIQLVNGRVEYFAYYSKWKPRTCSIAAARNGPYSHWEDNGSTSTVTLVDDKGVFTIARKGEAYQFVFKDIDRMRYCGMSGKINGSLTVQRGKSKCMVKGVLDGHEG